jgi:hypothetical protein
VTNEVDRLAHRLHKRKASGGHLGERSPRRRPGSRRPELAGKLIVVILPTRSHHSSILFQDIAAQPGLVA